MPASTSAISRLPGSCIGGSPGPPVAAPGASTWRLSSARWPGSGGVRTSMAWPPPPPRRRSPARTIETTPSSSRRSSWESRSSRPAAMRLATCSVGLVSPRSTWLSIGALTPLRSARSRRRQVHRLAQRADARADVDRRPPSGRASPYARTLSRTAVSSRGVSFLEPDVLVLGGGGILGEGWMNGVLAGLEDAGRCHVRATVARSSARRRARSSPRGWSPGAQLRRPGNAAARRRAGRRRRARRACCATAVRGRLAGDGAAGRRSRWPPSAPGGRRRALARAAGACPARPLRADRPAPARRPSGARGSTGGCASARSTGPTAGAWCSARRARRRPVGRRRRAGVVRDPGGLRAGAHRRARVRRRRRVVGRRTSTPRRSRAGRACCASSRRARWACAARRSGSRPRSSCRRCAGGEPRSSASCPTATPPR